MEIKDFKLAELTKGTNRREVAEIELKKFNQRCRKYREWRDKIWRAFHDKNSIRN